MRNALQELRTPFYDKQDCLITLFHHRITYLVEDETRAITQRLSSMPTSRLISTQTWSDTVSDYKRTSRFRAPTEFSMLGTPNPEPVPLPSWAISVITSTPVHYYRTHP
jgi:hypothetical protein